MEAEESIPVFRKERDTSAPFFKLKPGQKFRAETGNYWTITPLIVRTTSEGNEYLARNLVLLAPNRARIDPSAWNSVEAGKVTLPKGSDIHVLAYLGEGEAVGVWAGRPLWLESETHYAPLGGNLGSAPYRIISPPQVPCEKVMRPERCSGTAYYTENKTEWWIRVKVKDRQGWIERGHYSISGTDSCGD